MGARVLIIGAGNVGLKIADGLARPRKVDRLILFGLCQGGGRVSAGVLESCYDCQVKFVEVDGTQQTEVERLLRAEKPDLVMQSASLLSPWAMYGREDPKAKALSAAGLGLQLPAQLPILATVMQAVRSVDFKGPVANLSFPDVSHVILDRFGLAPTIGLGNVSMVHLRVRAALRRQMVESEGVCEPSTLIRLVGHHRHVYDAVKAEAPPDPADGCRVYLGEDGVRADELAYQGVPIAPSIDYNIITAAAALPVLLALLPEADALRFSAPAPQALPGGYPILIKEGQVHLDMPPDSDLQEAVDFHWRIGRRDGIESVTEDGTVLFSEIAKQAVADIDPRLCEPLRLQDCLPRFQLLLRHVNA